MSWWKNTEKRNTNYPHRNVFIFPPPISHTLHGTEIRPPT